MSDNPFAEPEDGDRTVFRPMPGGQRGARPGAPAAVRPAAPPAQRRGPPPAALPDEEPPPPAPIPPGADLATIAHASSNPLAAAAAPLLQLLARLRNTATPPDQGDMRDRTAREMREFEKRARESGVPMDQVRPAHYALCASLDDVVLNTPWGAHGRWSQKTLGATFHKDDKAGEGFFDQLRMMRDRPQDHMPVLELMYICMALGFMGPFRTVPDGPAKMDRIREQTFALIAGQHAPAPALSADWKGVDAPYRPRRTRFPVWVGFCIALAAVAGFFVWTLNGLSAGSDEVYAQMLAAPPAAMPQIARSPLIRPPPPPPEPPPPGPADRLRAALAADIAARELTVVGTQSATIIRIPAAKLFPANNATLGPAASPLLERAAAALKSEPGPIRVVGYTDNQHVRTVQFPSSFTLSNARAQAVRAAMVKAPSALAAEAGRVAAEGRAEADAIAPNTTPEGREQNRRIDIVLQRQN